jgi:hypothetical protein
MLLLVAWSALTSVEVGEALGIPAGTGRPGCTGPQADRAALDRGATTTTRKRGLVSMNDQAKLKYA